METNGQQAYGGSGARDEALRDLQAADEAAAAIRDVSWPTWLYGVNAVLLGFVAATPAIARGDGSRESSTLLALAAVVIAVNMVAGYRMGIPFVVPTSRAFQVGVAVAAVSMVVSLVSSMFGAPAWVHVVCAVVAVVAYATGGFIRERGLK